MSFKTLCWMAGTFCLAAGWPAQAETEVDQVLGQYDRVQSVSCEIRKDTQMDKDNVRTLSTVYLLKPNRLHVENFSPVERQIIADGTNLYYFVKGDPKGFSRPIGKLDEDWKRQLVRVPGTAMEYLLRLQGMPETNLAATAEFPVRKGYQAAKWFSVVSLDASNRLTRIEFFDSADMRNRVACADYTEFLQPVEGVWFPCLHKIQFTKDGVTVTEVSRVTNLRVNTPVPADCFSLGPFFKNVKFVSSFEDIYK
jgi:hypothetical protein